MNGISALISAPESSLAPPPCEDTGTRNWSSPDTESVGDLISEFPAPELQEINDV